MGHGWEQCTEREPRVRGLRVNSQAWVCSIALAEHVEATRRTRRCKTAKIILLFFRKSRDHFLESVLDGESQLPMIRMVTSVLLSWLNQSA